MTAPYTLEQYVADLRAIAAQETDPVRITDRVAPLAQKFAKAPRSSDLERTNDGWANGMKFRMSPSILDWSHPP